MWGWGTVSRENSCPWKSEEDTESLELEVQDKGGCWDLNAGPLQE